MKIPIYHVDAFVLEKGVFSGNPAAVCPLEEWLDAEVMLQIAGENNLSETAFFVKRDSVFELRWFTPAVEVELCGHATLASAYVIFNFLGCKDWEIRFDTISGELHVSRQDPLLTMDLPANKPFPVQSFPFLEEVLGEAPREIWRARDYMAVYQWEEQVRFLKPDFARFNQLDSHGIIVTAPGMESDIVSRFFAPKVGINEDPVTGSAHTTLIPFWSERLQKKQIHALQLSRRGGELFCRHRGDRVSLSGRVAPYMKGEIVI